VGVQRSGEVALAGDRGQMYDRISTREHVADRVIVASDVRGDDTARPRPVDGDNVDAPHVVPGHLQTGHQAATDPPGRTRDDNPQT
jgi:hypothetical protein